MKKIFLPCVSQSQPDGLRFESIGCVSGIKFFHVTIPRYPYLKFHRFFFLSLFYFLPSA